MPKLEELYPENIRLDGGTQPRAKIDQRQCDEYGERMKAGDQFPPLDVYFDGEHYWLADGFHRLRASVFALPGKALMCNVYEGTVEDARWHSLSANKTHGLRRTYEDKQRAVETALRHPRGTGKSDRQIADHVGVHFETVAKYRRMLERAATIGKSDSRTGRDGRKIDVSKIGKRRSKTTKSGRDENGVSISRNARTPKRGHSEPCPMIPLQFSPNNPKTAAATLSQHFSRQFIETLILELTQRLSEPGDPE